MKVKCFGNSQEFLSSQGIKEDFSREDYRLIIGKEYTVYSLSEFYGYVWYCILDDGPEFPMWNPSMFFEISDPRLSRYWIYSLQKNYQNNVVPFFSFPEWIKNDYFYDSLTDGEDKEVEVFKNYKQLMDLEFPDKTITEVAQIGDEKWLICPICMDAWENSDASMAMVICPKCKKMLHNPRYKDELPHL